MTKRVPQQISSSRAAVRKGILRGTALCTSDLSSQPLILAILKNCDLITAEYEMKWNAICRHPHEPVYTAADRINAFASENSLGLHGHTLWWHEAIPPHLSRASDRQFADAALQHLEAMVNRYAGRLHSWDVVNEALEPADKRRDGLRSTRFLTALGPDYLGTAFRLAARSDPQAILVLNEMGLEYASPEAEQKRRLMLALLEQELARGTPIACLGIQSHLTALEQPREHPKFRAFLREIQAMGLSVMVTEMDVSDHLCPKDRKLRDMIVADTYSAYLDLVLEECNVLSVNTWGLSDDRSWLNGFMPRTDGASQRPLLLDKALRRKPPWHAVRRAILKADGVPAHAQSHAGTPETQDMNR